MQKTEWRFLKGWTTAELRQRIAKLDGVGRNFTDPVESIGPASGFGHHYSFALIGHESPGNPVRGGAFETAREAMNVYAFSDPRIVRGHFVRGSPLLHRKMLLELKVLGLRYLCGVQVGALREEQNEERTTFGFRYETLEGHVEAGAEWFVLEKDHASGLVSFRIEAAWRTGQFPNFWSRIGFHLVGRRYQRAWHRLVYARLRSVVGGADVLPPLPPHGRILHTGPYIPNPGVLTLGAASKKVPEGLNTEEHEMESNKQGRWVGPVALGWLAGMRSMSAPAVASQCVMARERENPDAFERTMGSKKAFAALAVLAGAELVADKLPGTPPRVGLVPLLGRVAAGAVSAAAVVPKSRRLLAAAVGGVAALASSYAMYGLRREVTRSGRVPDLAAALAEDAIGAGLAVGLWRRYSERRARAVVNPTLGQGPLAGLEQLEPLVPPPHAGL